MDDLNGNSHVVATHNCRKTILDTADERVNRYGVDQLIFRYVVHRHLCPPLDVCSATTLISVGCQGFHLDDRHSEIFCRVNQIFRIEHPLSEHIHLGVWAGCERPFLAFTEWAHVANAEPTKAILSFPTLIGDRRQGFVEMRDRRSLAIVFDRDKPSAVIDLDPYLVGLDISINRVLDQLEQNLKHGWIHAGQMQ